MGLLNERYGDHQSRDYITYLDLSQIGNLKIYKPPKEEYGAIDIVPYEILSEKHPLVAKNKAKIGSYDYTLDIWVHRNVGAVGIDCVCLAKNYSKPCPLCEYATERVKQFGREDKEYLQMKAKRRVVYNVVDAMKEKVEILVFEVSHFLFEKELIEKAKYEGNRRGIGPYLDFADPENGYTIEFRTSVVSYEGREALRYKDFVFNKRENFQITEELMRKAISFDKYIVLRDYNELMGILTGNDLPIENEEKEMKEENEEEGRIFTRKRVRRNIEEDKADDKVEEKREEEVSDRKPVPQRKTRKSKETNVEKCPYGLVFGRDCDEYDVCDDCKVWKQCRAYGRDYVPPF